MDWMVKVETRLKESILDPQGQAVKKGLEALGYQGIGDVHVGKYMELELSNIETRVRVRDTVEEMCQRLLANPVIEDYSYQIEKREG
ncbi:MAG: phosphoribosylformylglycinamidine synthase subunit PurS [Bacillota bacterium]